MLKVAPIGIKARLCPLFFISSGTINDCAAMIFGANVATDDEVVPAVAITGRAFIKNDLYVSPLTPRQKIFRTKVIIANL